jgi:hypothetical protein
MRRAHRADTTRASRRSQRTTTRGAVSAAPANATRGSFAAWNEYDDLATRTVVPSVTVRADAIRIADSAVEPIADPRRITGATVAHVVAQQANRTVERDHDHVVVAVVVEVAECRRAVHGQPSSSRNARASRP